MSRQRVLPVVLQYPIGYSYTHVFGEEMRGILYGKGGKDMKRLSLLFSSGLERMLQATLVTFPDTQPFYLRPLVYMRR